MANFLVVCGGTGRGILDDRESLGFDAVLQVDVYDENLPATDGHSFRVDLPVQVAHHIGLTNVAAMLSFSQNIERRISQKVAEITKAEQQLLDLTSQAPNQSNSIAVDQHNVEVRRNTLRLDTLRTEYHELRKRFEHTKKALSVTSPASINNGMSQSPCIGRAYVEDQLPTNQIRQALSQMMGVIDPNDAVVTFWVVASACGGTGQGIYIHVIDQIHHTMKNFPGRALKIKVVRIGSLTYMSISPKVNLNAIWSLLTDYGYIKKHWESSQKGDLQSQLNYYYLDLPDVGSGNQAKPQREAIVASAFKALTHKQLDRQFEVVFNNLVNSPKVVLARIGEWGHAFKQDSVYEQTIIELQHKLNQLLTPEHSDVLGGVSSFEKSFSGNSVIIKDEIEKRLTSAVVDSLGSEIPKPQQSLSVREIEQRPEWNRIMSFVDSTLTTMVNANFSNTVLFSVDLTDRNNVSLAFSPSTNRTKIFNETYIREVELAQIAVAKFDLLMTTQNNEEGVYKKLVDAFNMMRIPGVAGMFASNKDKKDRILEHIQPFLTQYAYVIKMIVEYKNASKIIDYARQELTTVTNVISSIYGTIIINPSTQAVTKSASLYDSFGGTKTWLQIIDENLRGNSDVAKRSPAFRRAIQMGARGLTESGFKQVLDIPANTSTRQIVEKINDHIGAQGSYWWQGIVPNFAAIPAQFRFKFRVFPQLPEQMFAIMQQENLALSQSRGVDAPVYIESSDNRYGLKIYGVECIAAGLSISDQFEQLIQQLTGVINPENAFFQNSDHIASNCLVTPGTPVFFPSEVNYQNSGLNNVKEFLMETMSAYVTVIDENIEPR